MLLRYQNCRSVPWYLTNKRTATTFLPHGNGAVSHELWKLSDALYARDVANGVVKTRLDAIRSLDKLRLAVFLNDIHSNVKDFPSDNLNWCDWLNKPDDGHLLDVKTAR